MTLDMGNADKLGNFRRELERLQIPLLPPDINKSMAEFAVEKTDDGKFGVRYALAAIKGVGRDAMNRLAEERAANGPFCQAKHTCLPGDAAGAGQCMAYCCSDADCGGAAGSCTIGVLQDAPTVGVCGVPDSGGTFLMATCTGIPNQAPSAGSCAP